MKFQGFGRGGGNQRRSFSEVGRVFDLVFILVFSRMHFSG